MKWLVAASVVAIAAVAAAAAVLLARQSGAVPASGTYRGTRPPRGISLPSFVLPRHDGGSVDSERLRGKVAELTTVDSACKESCPILIGEIADGLRRLRPAERRQVQAIAISIDPKLDTRASVTRFLRLRHALGLVEWLVAPVPRMRPVWKALQVLAAVDSGNADVHSGSVRVYDRQGRWVSHLNVGADLTPQNLAQDIRVALRTQRDD
jgi:cytochrome oxidase Cu insertion factor (SCO1/SenC/PrrC family)